MAEVILLGAGLGGIPLAYEIKDLLGSRDRLTVISNTDKYQFVPSNPWLAVGWRRQSDIEIPLVPVFKQAKPLFRRPLLSKW